MRMAEAGDGDEKIFTLCFAEDLFDHSMEMCFWFAQLFEVC